MKNLGELSEIFREEPNKAESAKLPGAGIAPKRCPRNSAAEKEQCPASIQSVRGSPKRRHSGRLKSENLPFRSASWLNVGLV